MNHQVIYRGETYFREGESCCIWPCAEATREQSRLHAHDFVEICYVLEGAGWHVVEGETAAVEKGAWFIIPHERAHVFYREAGAAELRTYNILFTTEFLNEPLLRMGELPSVTMSPAEQRECEGLLEQMALEYRERSEGYQAMLRAYLIELCVKVLRASRRRNVPDVGMRERQRLIERSIRFLERHYDEPLTLAQLAAESYVSKNYFCQLFKETTGMTAFQYLQQIRIERACELMKQDSRNVARIAREVGYNDYKAFYTAFRRQMACSPKAYVQARA